MLAQSRYLLILGFLVGITTSIYVGALFHNIETRSITNEFQRDVNSKVSAIEREISINFDVVYALAGLYNASEEVNEDEFTSFTSDILRRHAYIQALEWAPALHHSKRAEFETLQKQQHPSFEITERDDNNQLIKATQRDIYYPVTFIQPFLSNEAALGFDLGSNQKRLKSLNRATETGKLVVSPSIQLVQDNHSSIGFLVILPVYSDSPNSVEQRLKNLQGFVIGVFRVSDILQQAITPSDIHNIKFKLLDTTSSKYETLYQQGEFSNADDAIEITQQLNLVGGRQWTLITQASSNYIDSRYSSLPYVVGTLIFTVILIALLYAYLSLRRADEVELAVQQRTAELNAAKEELERLSLLDGLTGIANRRHFNDFMKQEWAHAMRMRKPISLIMLDVDHFKAYNDHYGHNAGDHCLKQVAKTLSECVHRSSDLLARYGGEEFAIVLLDTRDALTVAETCREAIEALEMPHDKSASSKFVTASFGCAALIPSPDINRSYKELINQADEALYLAKNSGRNCCIDSSTSSKSD